MSARILVVDDILPNVKLLEAKLMSQYYEVVTASNGQEALDKVESENPDIILLDVMMPGMDGFEVCTRLKANPKTAHIPVVMVTALTDSQDKIRGLEAGADDFLSKPINDTALMARVRSLSRLKMALDEWRVRENTANQLGVTNTESGDVMSQSVSEANILVIEDREFDRKRIADTVAADHDIVESVSNGPDALEKIAEQEFDLLVVSLNLVHEDGLRLVSHLRSNERTRNLPIVMIGEEDDMDRIAHGLEIGAHDYIMRPVEKNELLARIRTQIRRKRFQEKLRSSYEASLSMALTDQLTGLYNRRYFEVHLQKLLEKNNESKKSLGLLMFDIDNFKMVNDTHGHNVGDEILVQFAERLKNGLRSFDLVARLGGEEFVVILPEVSVARAHMISERMRRMIADTPFPCGAAEGELTITTSIGGTIIEAGVPDMKDVMERVDKCLYEAKDSGRNAVVFEGIGKLDPDSITITQRVAAEDE